MYSEGAFVKQKLLLTSGSHQQEDVPLLGHTTRCPQFPQTDVRATRPFGSGTMNVNSIHLQNRFWIRRVFRRVKKTKCTDDSPRLPCSSCDSMAGCAHSRWENFRRNHKSRRVRTEVGEEECQGVYIATNPSTWSKK